ncbi:MAG: exosortase U [Verrucomicrobiota bacterium]
MAVLPKSVVANGDEDGPTGEGGAHQYRWVLLNGLLLLLAFGPALMTYGRDLWNRSHYQFFPAAIAGALLLARRQLIEMEDKPALQPTSPGMAKTFFAGALLLLVVGTVWWSPWLGYIAALVTSAAILIMVGGGALLRKLMPPLLLLAILIHPPLNLDREFALWLRGVAIRFSSCLLDTMQVSHYVSGTVIEIPGFSMLVEEACSGITSIFTVMAMALFHGLWKKRHPVHIALVVITAMSLVVLGNVFRISLGAYLTLRCDVNLLSGWAHEILGLLMFGFYLAAILSVDRLLLCGQRDTRQETEKAMDAWESQFNMHQISHQLSQAAIHAFSERWFFRMMLVYAGVGLIQFALLVTDAWPRYATPLAVFGPSLKPDAPLVLPVTLAGWKQLTDDPETQSRPGLMEIAAMNSKLWTFYKDRMVCVVALSYPYPGFHDLGVCYAGRGWELSEPVYRTEGTSAEKTIIEFDMTKKPVTSAFLLYGAFSEDGHWHPPDLTQRLLTRLGISLSGHAQAMTYQVQLLCINYHTLSPSEKAQALKLFLGTRQLLLQQVLTQLRRPPAAKSSVLPEPSTARRP